LGSLGEEKSLGGLKKRVTKMGSQKQTLHKPLAGDERAEITRKVNYTTAKVEVGKWTDAVKTMRQAEKLSFPLNADS